MSTRKEIVIALVSIILVFMLVVSMAANTRAISLSKYKYEYHYKMLPKEQVDNPAFIQEYILKRLPEGSKIIHFVAEISYFNNRNPVKSNSAPSSVSHRGYYVTNISGPYEMWGTHSIDGAISSGPGKATIYISGRELIPNLFNTNTKVTASVISEGVGFSVTKSYNPVVECSLTTNSPSGVIEGAIEVYPIYDVYHYDVMYKPLIGKAYKVGKGSASKAVGIFCLKYTYKY